MTGLQRVVFYNYDGDVYQVHSVVIGDDVDAYAKEFMAKDDKAIDYHIEE